MKLMAAISAFIPVCHPGVRRDLGLAMLAAAVRESTRHKIPAFAGMTHVLFIMQRTLKLYTGENDG